jgi:hypothetical protein
MKFYTKEKFYVNIKKAQEKKLQRLSSETNDEKKAEIER